MKEQDMRNISERKTKTNRLVDVVDRKNKRKQNNKEQTANQSYTCTDEAINLIFKLFFTK